MVIIINIACALFAVCLLGLGVGQYCMRMKHWMPIVVAGVVGLFVSVFVWFRDMDSLLLSLPYLLAVSAVIKHSALRGFLPLEEAGSVRSE